MSTTATKAAYDECRRIARASGSSFYAGMRLLEPGRRDAIFAVYALARRIDDVADGAGGRDAKLAALATIRTSLGGNGADPVLLAVRDAARRYPIPLEAFDDLIAGAEMDVRGCTYPTFADLEPYCRRVAGSIGRLTLGIFQTDDRASATGFADELGVALQLTNIVRDVKEDVAHGRVYLPAEDLDRFGCRVENGSLAGPAELLVAFESQRALGWLERGLRLLPLLDRRSAACVRAMTGMYGRLLERMAARPALPLRGRVGLRGWEKGLVLTRSLVGGSR